MSVFYQQLTDLCAWIRNLQWIAVPVAEFSHSYAVAARNLGNRVEGPANSSFMTVDPAGHPGYPSSGQETPESWMFFKFASEACLITDSAGRIVAANEAAADLLHMRLDQLREENLLQRIETPDSQECLWSWTDVGIENLDAVLRSSAGAVPVRIRAYRAEERGAIHWIIQDRRAETDSRKWFSIFESACSGMVVCDPARDTMETVNPAFAAMLGYSAEELKGRLLVGYLAPTYRAAWLEHLMRVAIEGRNRCECEFVRKDGAVVPVCADSTLVKDASGTSLYRVDCFCRTGCSQEDSAARRRARELECCIEELARSNAELENFADLVAHDLRAPLMTLSGCVELLLSEAGSGPTTPGREAIETAQQIIRNMGELIESVLAYSRTGKDLKLSLCDCEAVLTRVLRNLQASIQAAGAQVSHERLPVIWADQRQIARLFQNLIENAVKYRAPARPEIHISVHKEPQQWLFTVRDNGVGIPAEHLDAVFQLFKRVDSNPPGCGIGLATCKRIVDQHGGRIWAHSGPGSGTRILFTIPQ